MTRISLTFLVAICILAAAAPADGGKRVRSCNDCGQPIRGAYFETGGAYYHPQHFTCTHCDEPITGTYTIYKDAQYHTRCFERHAALRCRVCNGVISGKYVLDHWGNAYHPTHDDVAKCDFCARYIIGSLIDNIRRFHDGRFLCGICNRTSVTSLDRAEQLMEDVAASLSRYGIDVNTDEIDLHLMSKDGLRDYSGRGHGTTGFTDYYVKRNLFGRTIEKRVRVNLLYGMPRTEMIGTLAHELTHVWQFSNGGLEQNPAFSEGSCNYASYLVLRKIGGPEAEFIIETMLKDGDPVYGEGFRQVKAYAEQEGLVAWLKLLKKKNVDLRTMMSAASP